jgi:hypothetical protein
LIRIAWALRHESSMRGGSRRRKGCGFQTETLPIPRFSPEVTSIPNRTLQL